MKYCVRCGGEMADTAVVCPRCGAQTVPPVEDKPDTAMNVISFFIPLVGLILFLVYHDRQPRKAKSAGKFALIGVGLAAAVVLVMGAAAGSRLARQQAVDEAWEAAERSLAGGGGCLSSEPGTGSSHRGPSAGHGGL